MISSSQWFSFTACGARPCENGGTCRPVVPVAGYDKGDDCDPIFKCDCPPGFAGEFCEQLSKFS